MPRAVANGLFIRSRIKATVMCSANFCRHLLVLWVRHGWLVLEIWCLKVATMKNALDYVPDLEPQ